MQPFSLQSHILATLPLERLERICSEESTLREALDCQWGVWRERAQVLFRIDPQYFDLPRTLTFFLPSGLLFPGREMSGYQRYIEVSNLRKLDFSSAIQVSPDGKLQGLYEPPAGLLRALTENDLRIAEYFASLCSQETLHYLVEVIDKSLKEYTLTYTPAMRELFSLQPAEKVQNEDELRSADEDEDQRIIDAVHEGSISAFEEGLIYNPRQSFYWFRLSLYAGNIDLVNYAARRVLRVPADFTLDKYVPRRPFQVVSPDWYRQGERPFPLVADLRAPQEEIGRYDPVQVKLACEAACYSNNVQIVDFVRSYFGLERLETTLDEEINCVDSTIEGYRKYGKAIDAYSILQRINPASFYPQLHNPGTVDMFMYLLAGSLAEGTLNSDFLGQLYRGNLGYIPLLIAAKSVIPFLTPRSRVEEKRDLELLYADETDLAFYPLSREILEETIEI